MRWGVREENRVKGSLGKPDGCRAGVDCTGVGIKCAVGGDAPEGPRGSGQRRCSEGSSVGSLWCRRGGTMVSAKRPRDRSKNQKVTVEVGGEGKEFFVEKRTVSVLKL